MILSVMESPSSNQEIIQIPLAQANGIENVLPASLKGLVLHFNDGAAVIADVVQGGDKGRPVHISQAGDFRGHIVRAAGFHYIELTATKGWTEHVFPDQSFQRLLEVKDKLDEAGLIPFAMSGHTNLMDTARIPDFVKNIRLAHFFGARYIVSSVGEAHLKDNAVASNAVVAEHIRGFLPYLEKYDMILVLEVHGDHGTGAILKEIVNLVGSDRVRINYDTANAIFYGDVDVVQDLGACMDRVGYIHLKDKAGGRKEWDFPALGKGYVPFPELFAMLDKAENHSPFSIEIEFTAAGPKDLAEVNQAVLDSARYLKEHGFDL